MGVDVHVGVGARVRLDLNVLVPINIAFHAGLTTAADGLSDQVIRRRSVDHADVLAIAIRHGRDVGAHRDELSIRVLGRSTATWTDAEGDLVARTALVRGSTEHAAGHGEQERVVIESSVGLPAESAGGFSKEGKGL